MAETVRLPHQWTPRPYQQRLWTYLSSGGKRAVVCAHRRWGKDDVALHHTACAAYERVGNYAHMLPKYEQARKAIWDAVNPHTGMRRIDEAFPPAIRANTNDQEMKLRLTNGSTWQVVGSDNYNSLMGTSYAGVVKSEEAISNPSAWGYLSPIIRENDGWVLFISTPRGHNHFENLLTTAQKEVDWFWQISTVAESDVFTQEELQAELRLLQGQHGEDYGRSLFQQEYYCSFDAAIPGSIWGDCLDRLQREGRICDLSIDPTVPVDTGWDLGRTDDTSIWFRQFCGREINVIDHHASHFKDIPFYIALLLEKQRTHGLIYGTHWLPHDARPRTLAAGGKSILQQFSDAAKQYPTLGRFAIAPRLDRQEGIQAARATFPHCRFDRLRCEKGVQHLRQYHRVYDEEKKMFLDIPEHDASSHDADAWRILSLTWRYKEPKQPDSPLIDQLQAGNPVTQTFGTLKQKHFNTTRLQREMAML